ncbi:MAG: hypothetical protein HOY78_29255, partial [Saccharothrix sp.]|nr:hypothetical protein [Saccharothrix sp.]
PAATWADGAAGIVVPEAQPVGEHTAEQVADAYQQVKAAIVAARLDRALVEGHDATTFLGLFAEEHQEWLRERFDGAHDPEASAYATRVAKGQHLLPVEPKVSGTMRAEVGESGELVVRTNHVFAYAFATALPVVDPMEVVAALRTEAEYAVFSDRRYRPASRGLWLRHVKGFRHSIGCEASKAGFLAPSISEVARSTRRSEHENEYYFDHSRPMATDGTCPD